MEQRKRRRDALQRLIRKNSATPHLDVLKFTPGTLFMNMFDTELQEWANKLQQRLGIPCSVSGSNEEGEGEMKLIQQLKKLVKKQESVTILCNDSDLMMHLLSFPADLSLINVIYQNVHDQFSPHEFLKTFVKQQNLPFLPECYWQMGQSISFLSLLLGNDCLPRVRTLTFERLMANYISWLKEYNLDKKLLYTNLNNQETPLIHALHFAHFLQKCQTSFKRNLKVDPETKTTSPEDFMQGILWQYHVYQLGYVPNLTQSFDYMSPIHINELKNYFMKQQHQNVELTSSFIKEKSLFSMTPDLCACLVILFFCACIKKMY